MGNERWVVSDEQRHVIGEQWGDRKIVIMHPLMSYNLWIYGTTKDAFDINNLHGVYNK